MSDDEHVSNEELEAARDMEMDDGADEEKQPQPKTNKAEAAEEEGEEERDDSDDNSEKSDEAIEDNEEPEVDGDSREPSDGESIDGEESETEHEKRMRKAAALRFLDIEADEGTEKKIIKHLKKKIEDGDDENAYEKDSIMDDEGVITYDTDYEEERKKKKGSKADDKKKKKRKRIVTPPSSSSDEEEEAAEQGSEDEAEQIEEVSDDELQNMQTLAGTNKNKKVSGANPPRGKAAFHEHSDIAKAAAEKKKQKVSPESLLDSPKLKPSAAPKKQAGAAAAASANDKKAPAAKKPRKAKAPKNQLGDIFETKEKGKAQAWRITFRGEDAPMTLSPSTGKYELMPHIFHPKYFCTAEKLGETDTGIWDELGVFELFFTSATGTGAPKKINAQWATSGWNTFNSQSNDERYQYVIDALNNNNIVKGTDAEGKATKRKMFTDQLLQQIKSEAVLNPDGEWAWMPKHMEQHDFITPRKADGSAAVSVKAAAASPHKKKPPVQQKPKIDRRKETSSHDVKAMLSKPPSTKKEAPAAAAAAAAASSAPNSNKITPKKKENFADWFGESSPEPTQVEEQAKIYGEAKALPNTMLMLAQFIEMTFHRMATNGKKAMAVERIQRFFETVDETLKTLDNMDETLSLKQKCELLDKSIVEDLPKEMSKGFYMIVIMLPFFNAEAAQMMRDHLAGLAEKM